MLKYFYTLVLTLFIPSCFLFSQSSSIFDIDINEYPLIKAKVWLFDENGIHVESPQLSDVKVSEDGAFVDINSLECFTSQAPEPISSVLNIDISGSMIGARMATAMAASRAWINSLPDNSECAVTTFNHLNYLDQDFTTDKTKLINVVNGLKAYGGTDYNAAFIDEPFGSLLVASRGEYENRVVVFITDGNTYGNKEKILALAHQHNITIYVITLAMETPQILKEVSLQTKGNYFEYISNELEAESIFRGILQTVNGKKPCNISWYSNSCKYNRVAHSYYKLVESPLKKFIVSSHYLSSLSFKPSQSIHFGVLKPGPAKDTVIEVRAINDEIMINSITGNNEFQVSFPDSIPPFKLLKGDKFNLKITFAPTDTLYTFFKLLINSNACTNKDIYLSGGHRNSDGGVNDLKITFPAGGENLITCTDTSIIWDGILPEDKVSIDISTNDGANWSNIQESAGGLSFDWKVIQTEKDLDDCKIRLRHINEESLNEILYLTDHESSVNSLEWTDNNLLISGGDDNRIIIWDSKTGKSQHVIDDAAVPVYSISVMPDGDKFVASLGSFIKIYDMNGDEFRELRSDFNIFNSVAWSPNGISIAGGNRQGSLYIWEFPGDEPISSFKAHDRSINSVSWSYDSKYLASGSNDNSVKIWKPGVSFVLDTIIDMGFPVLDVKWNPMANLLSIAGESGIINIWDHTQRKFIKQLFTYSSKVLSTSWNYKSEIFAASTENAAVKLWNAITWDSLYSFAGHNAAVKVVAWSKSENRISSGSEDTNIEIWSPDDIPLDGPIIQEATSEKFSIKVPRIQSFDVYFGNVILGSIKDSVITGLLRNISIVPAAIDSIKVDTSKGFSILSDTGPFELSPSEIKNIEFRFTPKSVGNFSGDFEIFTPSDTIQGKIFATGIKKGVEFLSGIIDFGRLVTGSDSTKIISIGRNISNSSVIIDSIKLKESNDFSIIKINGKEYDSKGNITLGINEDIILELKFSPKKSGQAFNDISIYYQNAGYQPKVRMTGEGLDYILNYSNKIIFPEVKCTPVVNSSKLILQNIGADAVHVSEINIDDAENQFSLKTPFAPYDIPPGQIDTIDVSYDPKIKGFSTATAIIKTSFLGKDTTLESRLEGRYDLIDFEFDPDIVDFGAVLENRNKQSSFNIINNGTINLNWQTPITINEFVIDSIIPPFVLSNGGVSKAYVRFKSDKEGISNEIYQFKDTLCGIQNNIEFIAEVIPAFAEIESLSDIKIGNKICKPFEPVIKNIDIKNIGNDSLFIKSVDLSMGSNFEIIFKPDTILSGEGSSVRVRWQSNETGMMFDTIRITSNSVNGDIRIPLSASYDYSEFELSELQLDFIDIDENNSSDMTLEIKNTGTLPINWDNYNFALNDFEIISIDPIVTPVGGSSDVTVRFKGGTASSGYLEICTFKDICDNSVELELKANVKGPIGITIKVADTCGLPGDSISIPIILENGILPENGFEGFTTDISLENSFLVPADGINYIIDNGLIIINDFKLLPPKIGSNIMAEIPFQVRFHPVDSIDIYLSNTRAIGKSFIITEEAGEFHLSCDMNFNVESYPCGEITLFQNIPNPSDQSTTFVYELKESDINISLSLYHLDGRMVKGKPINTGMKEKGFHYIDYSTSELANGIYLFELRTTWCKLIGKMIISR